MKPISSLSTVYVRVPVRHRESGSFTDPTADTVKLAYVALGDEPVEDDWASGSWETDNGRYFARILTGPDGDIDPGDGTWNLWVRVTDNPEIPVQSAGVVVIT